MPTIEQVPRIFISYAAADRGPAMRVAADLRESGYHVWIDVEGLVPGTPDWENAIRGAIAQSAALVFLATPEAQKSPYVRSEIMLASSRSLRIFPLLIEGEHLVESMPLGLTSAQVLDLRAEKYAEGVGQLVSVLHQYYEPLPHHFMFHGAYVGSDEPVSLPNFEYCGSTGLMQMYRVAGLGDYVELWTVDPWSHIDEQTRRADAIFFDSLRFERFDSLLDDLYVDYFSNTFPPHSYGSEWYIAQDESEGALRRVLIDPASVAQPGASIERAATVQSLDRPPMEYGLEPGSRWQVYSGAPSNIYAIGFFDEAVLEVLLTQPKSVRHVLETCFASDGDSDQPQDEMRWAVVTPGWFDHGLSEVLSASKIVQVEEFPEQMKDRYLRY